MMKYFFILTAGMLQSYTCNKCGNYTHILYQCKIPDFDNVLQLYKMSPLGEPGERFQGTLCITTFFLKKDFIYLF